MTSRLSEPVAPESDAAQAAFFAAVLERRTSPLNLHAALAHAPPAGTAFVRLAYALRFDAVLDRALQELAIAAVAALSGSEYEWAQHAPLALAAGISAEQLDAVRAGVLDSVLFDARGRAVLRYTRDVLRREPVDDAFAELRSFLDEREIVELTLTIAFYGATAQVIAALGIDPEPIR